MKFAVIALRNLARNRRRTLLSLLIVAAGTVGILLTTGFIRFSFEGLREAIIHGAVKRIRPKMMTVTAAFMGLMPVMWSLGTGADMMKRVVAPMVGGLITSFVLELLVYPPIYEMWKWRFELKRGQVDPSTIPVPATLRH